jgi:hypothetical protein
LSHTFPIGQVRVDDGQRGAVESHAALSSILGIAVDEAAIKNEVVRKVTEISLIANAEPYEGVDVSSIARRELYRDEAEVVSAGAVCSAGLPAGPTIFGIRLRAAGVIRVPAGGKLVSAADERTTIYPAPDLTGNVNGPV